MSATKITVVTPCLNQKRFIGKTIDSVLEQQYPNLEYIVVDGGSTDGSIEVIASYDSFLAYFVSEPDRGMYDAINKGFQKSTGEIMLWINSDDMLHGDALRNVAEIFDKFPGVHWITGINTAFDENGRVIAAYPASRFSEYDLHMGNFKWIQQESTVWRRSLWNRAGGFVHESAKLAGDLELWLRFSRLEKLVPCELLIGGFRFREGQLSIEQHTSYLAEAESFIEASRKRLGAREKRAIWLLKLIGFARAFLQYTIVLDLRIFERILDKLARTVHEYPKSIVVDRKTLVLRISH
jgi:glycosyltransferase involved in cell wall biosynthesis